MSTDWIVVVVLTGLLVIVTAYSVLLAFRSRDDRNADEREAERSRDELESGPEAAPKAA